MTSSYSRTEVLLYSLWHHRKFFMSKSTSRTGLLSQSRPIWPKHRTGEQSSQRRWIRETLKSKFDLLGLVKSRSVGFSPTQHTCSALQTVFRSQRYVVKWIG